jgi:hypothetical protein
MKKQHTIKWLILFLTIIDYVHSFDMFIKTPIDNNNQTIEKLKYFSNKTYEIPLFHTRYITIRINPDDLHQDGNTTDRNIVGFRFQVHSTDIRVVDVRKEIMVPTKSKNGTQPNNILLEDLFICE